jgi:membrane protein YqaA with SNARE-associated domain
MTRSYYPANKTPVLIVCALMGMPLTEVFASVLVGKLIKYIVSAAFADTALKHVTIRPQNIASDRSLQ